MRREQATSGDRCGHGGSGWRRALALAVAGAGLWGAFVGAPPVEAADVPAYDAVALDAQTRQHVKDKAVDAVRADVAEIVKAYAVVDAKGQKLLGGALAAALRGITDDASQKVVIDAIGETRDKSLSGLLRPFLAQPDKKSIPPLLKPALEAAGKLADEDLVIPIMAIVKDSKNYEIAAVAVKAFAGYGASKRLRQNILRDLVLTIGKDEPSVGNRWKNDDGAGPYATARTRSSEDAKARYGALSPVMVETLNKMSGQTCASPEDWFSLYDRYKNSLGTLFPDGK